jgi:hypothetical protein
MLILDEDNIESFIRENKDKFEIHRPPGSHLDNFFFKLNYRIKHLINIVPYLVRVAIATVIIFAASIFFWNNYLRRDRNEITLTHKITLMIERITDSQKY